MNSVALHGDGCPICQSVEKELIKLSRDINCSLQVGNECVEVGGTLSNSRQLKRTISTAGVKGTSRGGKEKKKCKIPNRGVFVLFGHECSRTGGGMCEVEARGLMDLPVLSPLCVQSSQSASSSEDSCEGAQAYPPTPPIMLQVSCKSCAQCSTTCVSVVVPSDLRRHFDCSGLPLKLLSSNFDSSLTPRRGILVQQMERFSNLFNSTYPSA